MLARAAKPVHVCLRCQRNLARANFNSPGAAESVNRCVPRRWQSAATHPLIHEAVADDDKDNKNFSESNLQPDPTSPPRPSVRRLNFRKWTPKPTAQLGVNSLGKPAEVLLLPTRDRRIPQVPKDEGTEKMLGSTLQESIDSENVPLSGQKLAENIEQVRSLVGKMRGQLEKHEWTALKRHLANGFQKAQLKKYIRLRKGNFSSSEDLDKCNKREIIKYLVEEVWGFTTPVQDESAAPPGKQSKMVLSLREPVKLDHLLMHPSEPLKRIAEELDVQFDVYPSQCRIRAMGSKANAQQALQRISRYTKNLGQIVIQLKGSRYAMYQDPASKDYLNAYLKSIQRKYQGLNIGMDEQCIRIVHLGNPRGADQARREILLSVPTENLSEKSAIWPPMGISATALQPFPTPSEFPAILHHSQWARLVSSSPSSKTSKAITRKTAALAPLLQGLRETFDPSTRIHNTGNRQELYYDMAARFGQALIQKLPRAVEGGVDKDTTGSAEGQGGSTIAILARGCKPEKSEIREHNPSTKNQRAEDGFSQVQRNASNVVNHEPHSDTTSKAQDADGEDEREALLERPAPTQKTEMKRFVGGGPFLAQHLALMASWTQAPLEASKDVDKNARAILRLELLPISTSKGLPTFEIYVTAGESVGGQRPRLKIIRVAAIHHETHFTVLCPQNDIDVQFTQQLKQDLVYPGSAETDVARLLINALRGYIGNAQARGSSDWVFLPFLTLQVHHSLLDAHKRIQHAVTQSEGTGTRGAAETESKKSTPGMVEKKHEYILRSVDVVDVDSRLFSVHSASKLPKNKSSLNSTSKHSPQPTANFCLDHVTYTGAVATRQELRLAERPLLYAPNLAQPDFPTFVKAALEVAKRLGENRVEPALGQTFL
ncbi:uncharacterized protein A1O5_12502 [Cladophialophora psammophila CBS 110553]|uniref:Uncharacterized protein n=1 Tax=Cladophialophora psammophila CBS 110553 TaxID=1182543 RepID=W9VPQ6_9EURO|nr:uncharacterized protein A1O5_12502 [Cladophialophora psammophila CBS 110553]EXJ57712.1 hypothetical protein A1O5_12502 [Cladophialophora psammophila CBS 110553]